MKWKGLAYWWVAGAVVGAGLAGMDQPAPWAWVVYLLLGIAAAEVARRLWRLVQGEGAPSSLLAALVVGLLLRLLLSIAWTALLPDFGNDVPPHDAGIFFPDAWDRDRTGHAIGRSEESLLAAFDNAKGDQYGTLLFATSAIYRVFGPEVETTAIPSAAAAYFGALAILLTWAFAHKAFGPRVAGISAWFVALYPEAVLLGSQSMREPYVMAGVAAALYGYALARDGRGREGLRWIAGGGLLSLLVSPPFGLITVLVIGVGWLWEGRVRGLVAQLATVVLTALFVLALVLTIRAWSNLLSGDPQPLDALSAWLTGSGYEVRELVLVSGFFEQIFRQTPVWAHVPLVTLTGLIQPLLPASIMDNTGVLLTRIVMIWRSLGWFIVLPVLLYAPVATVRREGWRSLATFLCFVMIFSTVVISYRFGGDQWDSPRYRTALVTMLAALVGWSWVTARDQRDRWLVWLASLVGLETVIIGWWYAGRYYHLPRLALYPTLLIGACAGAALLIAAAVVERMRRSG